MKTVSLDNIKTGSKGKTARQVNNRFIFINTDMRMVLIF